MEDKKRIERPTTFDEVRSIPITTKKDVEIFLSKNGMSPTYYRRINKYRNDFDRIYIQFKAIIESDNIDYGHLYSLSNIKEQIRNEIAHNLAVETFITKFMDDWLSKEKSGMPIPPLSYLEGLSEDSRTILLNLQDSDDTKKNGIWANLLNEREIALSAANTLKDLEERYNVLWETLSISFVTTPFSQ